MARVANDATAFAHRERRYSWQSSGFGSMPARTLAVHEAWTAALWQTFHREGNGVYVNFLEVEGPDRVREAYPPATYARLAAIKRRYDPGNLFRFNQNVPPAPVGLLSAAGARPDGSQPRSRSASSAQLRPGAPKTAPPGQAPEPQR